MEEYSPAIKKAVIISATLSSFLTPFMASSINIALPTIGKEFSMSAIYLSWVASTYLLTAAMFLVPLGKAADISRGFTLTIVFSPADIIRVQGKAHFLLNRNKHDDIWKIQTWWDESNY